MGDRIQVPLELEDFDVIGSEVVDGVLEVEIRASRRPAAATASVSGFGVASGVADSRRTGITPGQAGRRPARSTADSP